MPLAGCWGRKGKELSDPEMGGMTRVLIAPLGSHAMMRRVFSLAIYHAHQRHVL